MSKQLVKIFTLLLVIFSLIYISEESISVNPSLQEKNFADGNRKKIILDLQSDDQNSGSPFMDEIGRRFRRHLNGDKIETTKFHFNDSHYVAEVHWSGSNSSAIMILMKDPSSVMSSARPSHFYVSRDYGKTFKNITEKFVLANGTTAVISNFFSSKVDNQKYILVAKFHKVLFISNDECLTFRNVSTTFHPAEITFHPRYSYYVLAHEGAMGSKQLYSSSTYGRRWTRKDYQVTAYSWGFSPPADRSSSIYYHKEMPSGNGALYKTSPWYRQYYYRYSRYGLLENNVTDFELVNQYIFIEKNGTTPGTKDLYVSVNRGTFNRANFPFNFNPQHQMKSAKSFIIADATENEALVAVGHDNKTANLYISNGEAANFSLSLSGILYFNQEDDPNSYSYFNHEFADVMRVDGVSGVYIATNLTDAPIGKRKATSWITFDKGGEWTQLRPPPEDRNCSMQSGCSLHVSHEYGYHNPFTRFTPIYSKSSAPGFILATGNLGSSLATSSALAPFVFLSTDAGLNWKKLFQGHYLYGFVDHGGVILAVQKRAYVDSLKYSWDEGHSWETYKFVDSAVRVYGLLTEPGEKSTVFTIFCSKPSKHSWMVLTINVTDVLGKPCTASDYTTWELTDTRNDSEHCSLGKKQVYERRLADKRCFNGYNYDRAVNVSNCLCTREDYMCDFGYREINFGWLGSICFPDTNIFNYTYREPSWCSAGKLYNVSSGYRKVPGDTCVGGMEKRFMPHTRACPMDNATNFLFYARSTSIYRYDIDKRRQIAIELNGLKDVIALEYDYAEKVLFYADITLDRIMMLNFTTGHLHEIMQFDESNTYIEALAYDWMNHNLYYTDTGSAEIGIVSIKTSSIFKRFKKVLLGPSVVGKPRGIAVHPAKGYMFWTDWGQNPGIYRANMDASDRKNLVSKNIQKPNGITIDYKEGYVYWTDSTMNRIERINIEGADSSRKVIINGHISQPYALDIWKEKLYWDDWSYHSIMNADKASGNNRLYTVRWVFKAMALKAYWPEKQKMTDNPCTRSNCSYTCLPLSNNKHVCSCPHGLSLGTDSKTCNCPTGEIYDSANGYCKPGKSKRCTTQQFQCQLSQECIPLHWKCDGDNDCSDSSDERVCTQNKTCPSNMFKCVTSGQCILSSWKCDKDRDCTDGSDERNCHNETTCSTGYRACPNKQCILSSWFCDGSNDCPDGFDEQNCQGRTTTTAATPTLVCQPPNIKCRQFGRVVCLDSHNRCDGSFECDDHSDERNCSNACRKGQIFCDDRSGCYSKTQKCDQTIDCNDASDEKNCHYITSPQPVYCPVGYFKCDSNKRCYGRESICNGIPDCSDRSDENNCQRTLAPHTAPLTTTPSYCAYRCNITNKCLSNMQLCDGNYDCPKGDDESARVCKKTSCSFRCREGKCLDANKVCDNKRDCNLGEDEYNCDKHLTGPEVDCRLSPPFSFRCTDDRKTCYNATVRCNGKATCNDASDEGSICKLTKHVQNLRAVASDETSITLRWELPDLKIDLKKFKGYILKNISRADAEKSKNPTTANYTGNDRVYQFRGLERCTEYLFAVAVNVQLPNSTDMLYVDILAETRGLVKPETSFIVDVHAEYLKWRENGPCARRITGHLLSRKLICDKIDGDAVFPSVIKVELKNEGSLVTPQVNFPSGAKKGEYYCVIEITYEKNDFFTRSKGFSFPPNDISASAIPSTGGSVSKNTLLWAIPVALVSLALLLGLGVMVYKYRRLQYSFLAFAARGSYTRQEDELDDVDDDNMIVGFRSGEETPMINRFSDDEPLVVA